MKMIAENKMMSSWTIQETLDDFNMTGELAPSSKQVHVLVVAPQPPPERGPPTRLSCMNRKSLLPRATHTAVLHEPEKFAEECTSLEEWRVGNVHKIPCIFRFMRTLGGCTVDGKIFWRLEEKQVVEVLMDGWFREPTADNINVHANKNSILIGSPGIGKSTVLCVLAFCLVLKYQKNVLVYRRLKMLDQESCLFYLGYEDGRVVQFTVPFAQWRSSVLWNDKQLRE
ncbi:hypothetical protein PR002_g20202 [Phytophthora rubi]|uniref:Uncharacterized protein n=1 Tax=Phytophthora rubi TaxID=129364 RepID=A0A6A3JJ47_9STRA|nr:hypothetical protein PR002_g20202 [Phytophthora rubi]